MDKELKRLRSLVRFMETNWVLHLKSGDAELSIHPNALKEKRKRRSAKAKEEDSTEAKTPEQDPLEVALWSAPQYLPPSEAS